MSFFLLLFPSVFPQLFFFFSGVSFFVSHFFAFFLCFFFCFYVFLVFFVFFFFPARFFVFGAFRPPFSCRGFLRTSGFFFSFGFSLAVSLTYLRFPRMGASPPVSSLLSFFFFRYGIWPILPNIRPPPRTAPRPFPFPVPACVQSSTEFGVPPPPLDSGRVLGQDPFFLLLSNPPGVLLFLFGEQPSPPPICAEDSPPFRERVPLSSLPRCEPTSHSSSGAPPSQPFFLLSTSVPVTISRLFPGHRAFLHAFPRGCPDRTVQKLPLGTIPFSVFFPMLMAFFPVPIRADGPFFFLVQKFFPKVRWEEKSPPPNRPPHVRGFF